MPKRSKPSPVSAVPCVAAVLLCAAAGAACDVNIREGKASVGMFSAEATDEWTHHYPLTADGLVEIINLNGPLNVTSGVPGTVDVRARITAKALTDAGARDVLAKGKIQETAEAGRVRIETMMPRGVNGSYVVQYDVRVPPGARADASTTNGSLTVTGLDGKLKATAVNGKVEIDDIRGAVDSVVANGSLTARFHEVSAPARLEVTNGRLALELPASARANLSARAVTGGLTVTGLPVNQPTGRRIRNLDTALNGGGPEITARVTNGRITIEGK